MKTNKLKISTLLATILLSSSLSYADMAEDRAITAEVEAKLALEQDVPSKKIKVTTKNNEVFLKGIVKSNLQANKAIELASSMKNVIDVHYNELLIEGTATPAEDSLITAKVKGRITQLFNDNKIAAGYQLAHETNNKEVHIHGTVTNLNDIDTIEKSIRSIRNVSAVKTNIQVRK